MSDLINIERRTGVKDVDIDSFVSKATLLEEAIRGLRDGTLDPKTLKIEGFDCDTDEEKAAKQVVKETKEKKRREAALALDLQRKKEEKELWWAGARLHVGERTSKTNGNKTRSEDEQEEGEESESQRRLKRYTADYSRW